MSRRELTEPEALVYAASFAQAVGNVEIVTEALLDRAAKSAWTAVLCLRQVRVRGRDEQARYRMLRDFRMDKEDKP